MTLRIAGLRNYFRARDVGVRVNACEDGMLGHAIHGVFEIKSLRVDGWRDSEASRLIFPTARAPE